jgi:hypothetical protein
MVLLPLWSDDSGGGLPMSDYSPLQHAVYVLRWIVLAVPGAWVLVQVQRRVRGTYAAMIVSQGVLGAAVFFIDRLIFK